MCLKPFVKMCIFVVIQIFWSLRKYDDDDGDGDGDGDGDDDDDDPCKNALMHHFWHQPVVLAIFRQYWYWKTHKNIF